MRRIKGFTLIELLVVISIIALLISILVPSISMAQKLARRAACGANLSGIGKSIALYQGIANDQYPMIQNRPASARSPRVRMDYAAEMLPGGSDDVFALDDGVAGGEDQGDTSNKLNVPENLNLLVKEKFVSAWKMFRCPQVSRDTMDRGASGNYAYGFRDKDGTIYIDYAMHNGYNAAKDANENAARFTNRMDGGMVILGDQHGYEVEGEDIPDFAKVDKDSDNMGRGWNHEDAGINVLTAGYSVNWSKSIYCGKEKDNVYAKDLTHTYNTSTNEDEYTVHYDQLQPGTPNAATDDSKLDTVLIKPSAGTSSN